MWMICAGLAVSMLHALDVSVGETEAAELEPEPEPDLCDVGSSAVSTSEGAVLGAELPEPRRARICEKWSAASWISRFAVMTSSRRPVMTNMGASPRIGVFMYVFVLARSAFCFWKINIRMV